MTKEELRQQFHLEAGIKWENSQGEPDIDYVQWLEQKVIIRHALTGGTTECICDNCGRKVTVCKYCQICDRDE
jgi:hypothetical protein